MLVSGVAEGDVGLVTFEARALALNGQAAEAALAIGSVFLEEAQSPYAKSVQLTFKSTAEWQVFYLPFLATLALPEGKGALVFHLGGQAQAFEIGPVRVLNYGKTLTLKDMPRTKVT